MNLESEAPNELALVEEVKSGRRARFDILVGLYQQRSFGIAYNLIGNVEDARDVLQEAFIKAYLHIREFEGKSRFSTWFYRILINCVFDFLRRRKRESRIFQKALEGEDRKDNVDVADVHSEPRRAGMAKEFAQKLDECIARLSKMQRACFVLKHQNSLSIQEISETLKCNPATVKVHIFRAVGNLRKHLAEYFKIEGGLKC